MDMGPKEAYFDDLLTLEITHRTRWGLLLLLICLLIERGVLAFRGCIRNSVAPQPMVRREARAYVCVCVCVWIVYTNLAILSPIY